MSADDVLIVASVSCIYGLGTPEYYKGMNLILSGGAQRRRDDLLLHLVEMQYKRNDYDFARATFRVRGDILEIFPAYEDDLAYTGRDCSATTSSASAKSIPSQAK